MKNTISYVCEKIMYYLNNANTALFKSKLSLEIGYIFWHIWGMEYACNACCLCIIVMYMAVLLFLLELCMGTAKLLL